MVELPPLIQCTRCFFQVLLYYFTVYIVFRVVLPRYSWGFYGELSFGFLGKADALRPNILWSTSPSQKSTIKSTSMVSPSMPKIIHVWQTCDGSNRVLHIVFPMKKLYRHDIMWRQMHRPIQISKAPGEMLFCHNAKFHYLHGGQCLIVLNLHLSRTGIFTLEPFIHGILAQSTSSCCFDGGLVMPSIWCLVGKSTHNASST